MGQGKEQNRIIMPGQEQIDPVQMVAMETQRIGMGLAHVSRTNALIGKAVDMCQLSLQLILNILVDKDVITEDELKTLYQEKVIDRYRKMEVEAKEFAEKQIEEQQTAEKQELNEQIKESEKASDAVVSDATKVIDNVTPISRDDG